MESKSPFSVNTQDALNTFSRTGRWGTCVACPRSNGHVYPEFCEYRNRYDHLLSKEELFDVVKRELDENHSTNS